MREPHIAGRKGVLNGGRDYRGHRYRAALPATFHAQRIERTRGRNVIELDPWDVHRRGHKIIHKRAGEDLTCIVVNDFFEEGVADAERDPANDLAINNHGIDYIPKVLNRDILEQLYLAGPPINLNERNVTPSGERIRRRAEVRDSAHAGSEIA